MDVILTPEQEAFRDRLRTIVDAHILPRSAEIDESTEVPWDIMRLLAEQSVQGIVIPEEYGGIGAGVEALPISLAREQLMRGSCNVDSLFAMQGLGSYPVILGGDQELKRAVLPPIAKAEKLAAYAVTEPAAGSDVAAIETRAERRGDGYIINGRKIFTSNAGVAATYVVLAKTNPSAGVKGISALLLDGDTPGFRTTEQFDLIAPHITGAIEMRDCYVPANRLLGKEGDGFKIAMQTFDVYRASVGAAAVGLAQGAMEEALAYALHRKQFGQPLADFQITQFKIADMATEIDAARMLVYRAAKLKDLGAARVTKEASMAKLFATEMAGRVVDQALQIHGGRGLRKGVRIERLYRQARAMRIYEGTSEIQRLIIGRTVIAESERGRK
ncbi:MAG: acyl-CoA dehydrogenase family protein [Candidatus Binataceae bacterium]|jgi:alkylation response protein AidB-like acyl-CoA dehydrogenase